MMPLDLNGVYLDCGDRAYEAESAYYLNFQIISALASLERLERYDPNFAWENRCQYYHYFCDHLLYSLGQISNRFLINERKDSKQRKERKEYNRLNFRFSEAAYPILSDKCARNVIEHIDEYNQCIIENKRGVGGFNLIDSETEPELATVLRSRKDTHPYTLDAIQRTLLIRRKNEDLSISLELLRDELLCLQRSVKSFLTIISNS